MIEDPELRELSDSLSDVIVLHSLLVAYTQKYPRNRDVHTMEGVMERLVEMRDELLASINRRLRQLANESDQ